METKNKSRIDKIAVMFSISAILLIASMSVAIWHSNAQSERADIRNNGQKTAANVISRTEIEFRTPEGLVKARPIVAPTQGTLKVYDIITVYYDKDNPKRVVLDQDDTAFNITMWIVAIKLFVASLVFAFFANKKRLKQA